MDDAKAKDGKELQTISAFEGTLYLPIKADGEVMKAIWKGQHGLYARDAQNGRRCKVVLPIEATNFCRDMKLRWVHVWRKELKTFETFEA